jgi:hypothetical protein
VPAQVFDVKMEQVETLRKTEREPPRPANAVRRPSKSVKPRSSQITPSPSMVAEATGKANSPSTISGTLSVHSLPWREKMRTRSPSRRAMNL